MRFHFNVASFVKAALVATLSVIALSACQTNSRAGKGQLNLSEDTKRGLQSYMNEMSPILFAASTDGRTYHYYYCTSSLCNNSSPIYQKVLDKCEQKSNSKCHFLANSRNIMWQKNNGETYTFDELMSDQVSLNSGTTSLCKIALDPKRQHWSQENAAAPYIAELTRRGVSIDFCTKLLAFTN